MQTMQTSSELSISEVRILSLASIGGALEFYDFVIFVFFADVIRKLFFAASLPDWVRQAAMTGRRASKEGGVEYRDAGKTECLEGECSLTTEDSDPTFWGEPKLH